MSYEKNKYITSLSILSEDLSRVAYYENIMCDSLEEAKLQIKNYPIERFGRPVQKHDLLIIQSTTDGKPDLFVPEVIVSENEIKLWHYMNKMFNNKLTEIDDVNLYLHRSFIDNTSACINCSSTTDGKEHSIHLTICRSTLL